MQRIRKSFLTLAATAGLLIGASIAVTPASAAPVQFSFNGLVSFADIPLNSVFAPNQVVSGTYTFESATSNIGGIGLGRYEGAIISPTFQLFVGPREYGLGSSGSNFVQIQNFGVNDIYTVRNPITPVVPPPPGVIGLFSPLAFQVEFEQPPTVFSGGNAPASLGNLFAVSNATFHVIFANGSTTRDVVGNLSMTPVPLPPAVILFGAGLVALIGLGARNWQFKGNNVA